MNRRLGVNVFVVAVSSAWFGQGCDWATHGAPATDGGPTLNTLSDRVNALEAKRDREVGRYQIVNPVPEGVHNTMLLDTVTGRTWIICTLTDVQGTESNGWCDMTQANGRGLTY
jgi:hypothetical protein